MPLPQQITYYIVAWANGVNSVHTSHGSATGHVKSMRGENDDFVTRGRRPEQIEKWKRTPARIIRVTSHEEEIV